MKRIMENWRGYLNEEELPSITTIGQLHDFFKERDPSWLQKKLGKYGSVVTKALGIGAGAAAGAATGGAGGVAGAAAGALAEKVVESLLMASILAFANIPDGSYEPGDGSAASFFDLDDNLQVFLRQLDTKDVSKMSTPEKEVFTEMEKIVKQAARGAEPNTPLSRVLRVTAQELLDRNLLSQDKIKIQTVGG